MMRPGGMLDAREFSKRIRRILDGNCSYRKFLVLLVVCGGLLLYFGPFFGQWLFSTRRDSSEAFEEQCMSERLAVFYFDTIEYNANILHEPRQALEQNYLPYIGNGKFGIPILPLGSIYIKHDRALSLPIHWNPMISHHLPTNDKFYREATVTHYTTGIVYKYQCLREGYYVEFQYYAHRRLDSILIQDIKITNPSTITHEVLFSPLQPPDVQYWINLHLETVTIQVDADNYDYTLVSGFLLIPDSNKAIAICIVYKIPLRSIQVKARSFVKIELLTSIQYSNPVLPEHYDPTLATTKKKAIEVMKIAIGRSKKSNLREDHVNLWETYWQTSFRISNSKAEGAINGDKINSTMYYVLSHVAKSALADVEKNVAKNDGCYHGHHTLNAPRLWKDTSSVENVNEVVKAWLVTLENQGCHHLMTGGPSAVQQAMVLSFGGLRFSNQHLEFNIDPQYLHRDYLFRRISYGNQTHLNISVTVGEDNRAVLAVALDKSDSGFFGCDAGCLDAPVPLGQTYVTFPVKLTKPLTAILYVTSDYKHMQDLRNALHVHAVAEAPAHDHEVLALHKHGHQLGGLPALFWVSICFLIIVFHLFLCKLIMNEYYYGHQEKQRARYCKP